MNRRICAVVVTLLMAVWLGASPDLLIAKEKSKEKPFALLFGSVFTAEGLALPGVAVIVKRKDDRKPKWRAVSDSRGEFAVRLPAEAATYEVTTQSKAHENQTKTVEISGRVNETATVIFRLACKEGERRQQP